jgi:hypothetical protein
MRCDQRPRIVQRAPTKRYYVVFPRRAA